MYVTNKHISGRGTCIDIMKKPAAVVNILASYYILSYIFYIFKFQSFIKDIVITPLYFLVPTGFGLLVFSIFDTHKKLLKSITGLQLILSSAFLGFLVISLIYTEHSIHDALPSRMFLLYPVINFLSLAGFYRSRDILKVNDTVRSVRNSFLISLPLFLIVYYYLFIHFSPFPFRDIFMEVHFMKGALEFSKYNILNPATGDTYFALLQVHSGLLHHFFGYNLINSQWILPAYLYSLYFLCFYCFYSSFIKDRFVLNTVMCLNTIFTSLMFSNSNNSYLIMLTVVFFSTLVNTNRERTKALPVFAGLLILCGLSVIFYLNREVPSYVNTMLPYLASYLILLFTVSALNLNRVLPFMFLALLVLIAPPYHRAASLYIPLMLLLYALFFLCFQWNITGESLNRKALLKKAILYSIILAPVIIGIEIMINIGRPPKLTSFISDMINPLLLLMVGQRVSDNQGVIGTTAEFIRFVPPIVYLVFALLALELVRKKGSDRPRHFIEGNLNYFAFCVVSTLIFLIIFYSPLPNIHRVLVFQVLMIFALIAALFKYYYEAYLLTPKYSKTPLFLAGTIAAYTIIAKFIYDMPWKYADLTSPYIAGLSPIAYTGWILLFMSLLVLFFTRRTVLVPILTITILISGLFLDRFNMVTKLYDNSYGFEFPETKIISHYTQLELDTAEQLGNIIKSPLNLMFSDPSTLGIFEAQTGINGLYTFSNLGLMLDSYKDSIKNILRTAFTDVRENNGILYDSHPLETEAPGYAERNMDIMLMLAEFCDKHKGAVPEASYTIQTRLRNPFDVAAYGYDYTRWANEYKNKIYWIINEKTIRWAYGDAGYYPMNKPFSDSYINRHILPYFDVVLNSENSVLVLKLK